MSQENGFRRLPGVVILSFAAIAWVAIFWLGDGEIGISAVLLLVGAVLVNLFDDRRVVPRWYFVLMAAGLAIDGPRTTAMIAVAGFVLPLAEIRRGISRIGTRLLDTTAPELLGILTAVLSLAVFMQNATPPPVVVAIGGMLATGAWIAGARYLNGIRGSAAMDRAVLSEALIVTAVATATALFDDTGVVPAFLLLALVISLAGSVGSWWRPTLAPGTYLIEMITAIEGLVYGMDGRGERVGMLSREIASDLKESPRVIDAAERTGRVLSIFNLHEPQSVICRNGRLDVEERANIRRAPVAVATLLEDEGFDPMITDSLRRVREALDGTGYPDGEEEAQIPLIARIVHVAEAFDAMTTGRPYREPIDEDEALRVLTEHASRAFDPVVIRSLFRVRGKPMPSFDADETTPQIHSEEDDVEGEAVVHHEQPSLLMEDEESEPVTEHGSEE